MNQIQFIGTTPQQLRNDINNDVKTQIDELKKCFQPKNPEELLSRSETAELLKINLSTLYLWTKKRKLKSYGLSGKVYYKRSEVESALIALND
ncbi:helix-turn-helix domain-containing protein [Muricauda oceani]|uniref:Helix-turn-helix domain-containing protein n=1 Tax=Flagellimonas oceani TaxID=2698672 RepID=A0A6G7J6U5_9FLAO|nr:helix-turn-helix domain-containing protein [Allomuricauda oceani]MBW8243044.1 helix-turn-helix domain-containing protein [Allomuricauda oceani]QII46601.1 helix-turn-helix domain-containing protein [Allomuricauda oceani]